MQVAEFNTPHSNFSNSDSSNLWVFFGGFFYNLFNSVNLQYLNTHTSLIDYIFSTQGIEYIFHSVIGGFIALAFKLLFVFIKDVLFKKSNTNNSSSNNPS